MENGAERLGGINEALLRSLDPLALRSLVAAMVERTGNISFLDKLPFSRSAFEQLGNAEAAELSAWLHNLPVRDVAFLDDFAASELMAFVLQRDVPSEERRFHLEHLRPAQIDRKDATVTAQTRVLIIGGGMSGILAAIRLQAAGFDYLLVEKNPELGGTWHENTYPGCRVDVPSQSYSYSFYGNARWPHRFCEQPEISAYFKQCARYYGIESRCWLNSNVRRLAFDAASKSWRVSIEKADGSIEEQKFGAVITAVGQLNRPFIPKIPGLDSFSGPVFHSATWNHDVDLNGKRVAIIGTGASSTQFAPEVAKISKETVVVQISAPWLIPTPDYHEPIPAAQQDLLARFPEYLAWYRYALFMTTADSLMPFTTVDPNWSADGSVSAANDGLRDKLTRHLLAEAGDRADLHPKIIPDYPPGAKRLLRDNGSWFKMLRQDNVILETAGVKQIEPGTMVCDNDARYEVDVIIFGTGFSASGFLEGVSVTGASGKELNSIWDGDPSAYLGISVPDFPNFFILYGPNTNIVANGSIIAFSEYAMNHIVQGLQHMEANELATLVVRQASLDRFCREMDEANAKMAWGLDGVESWYKSRTGRVSQNWPLRVFDYWDATRTFDPADYVFQHRISA
ncbi:NAD(P)/FAD-dependent oxidoreductase [Blastomonas sp. UPD001]|uniref:NAD(P)/FAD-dependent oxidoreductase n=1 Tax=Blastomonas sp. UPD001 TaxID=2217673 RepID=UPI000E34C4EE|nr:NAD(P)/FAD-dependent oxidoreductase [Blastomonas sp. UPD001]